MAASQITSSDVMLERLRKVLLRARDVKQTTAIDPPLQVSALVPGNEEIFAPVPGDKDNHMIEEAARRIFYDKLGSTPITDPSFITIWDLLDILQYCCDRDLCSVQLVLILIEELLDSQSIAACRVAFTFLESRREALIANTSQSKSLVILRLCNELLRRLSRAEDPVFCGRVYIFLFQSFPLGDKSSVNLRGNFHLENVTTFEEILTRSTTGEKEAQVETGRPEDVKDEVTEESKPEVMIDRPSESGDAVKGKSAAMAIDDLYPVFWSLQHSFSNPPRLFEEENFQQFQRGLEATLEKFKEVPKVIQSGDSEHRKGAKPRSDEDYEDFASTFNPKYLTSRDLFKLELSDLAFQRHILVQALILIDFLLTLTEKERAKPYYQNAQKAMQYAFTLREEDTEWALGIKKSITNYLQDGPDGKFYHRMVDTVLSRDKNWVRWKMENCQPFTRDRVATKYFHEANSGAEAELRRKTVAKPMGRSSGLLFLSNTDAEKGLSRLRQADRFSAPSADSYAMKVRTSELDLEMVTSDEEKRQLEEGKTSNTWRGLRLASKHRLSTFDRLEHGKGLERLFQPATSIEAAGEEHASTGPEGRDPVPQEQHQSVEEPRADQRSQVTTGDGTD